MVKVLKNKQKKTHRNIKKYTKRSTRNSNLKNTNLKITKRKTKGNKRRSIQTNNFRKNSKKIKRKNKYGTRGGGPGMKRRGLTDEQDIRITSSLKKMVEAANRGKATPPNRREREALKKRAEQKAEEDYKQERFTKEHMYDEANWLCYEEAAVHLSPGNVKKDCSQDPRWKNANTRIGSDEEKIAAWKTKLEIVLEHREMEKYKNLTPIEIYEKYKEERKDKAAAEAARAAQAPEPAEALESPVPAEALESLVPAEDPEPAEAPEPLMPARQQEIGVGGKKCGPFDRFCAGRPRDPGEGRRRKPKRNRRGGGRRKRPQKTKRRTKRTN